MQEEQTEEKVIYFDSGAEWRHLSALMEAENQGHITDHTEDFFTEKRIPVFVAMREAYTKLHDITPDTIKSVLGYFPAELAAPHSVNYAASYKTLLKLAQKRHYHNMGMRLIEETKQESFLPERAAALTERRPIISRAQSSLVPVKDEFLVELDMKMNNEYEFLSTGNAELDRALGGGLPVGTDITVAGKRGGGKSYVKMNIIDSLVKQKAPTLTFEFDMTAKENLKRFAAFREGINSLDLATGSITRIDYERVSKRLDELAKEPLYMIDGDFMTFDQVAAESILHAEKFGIKVIVIDHLQAMPLPKSGYNITECFKDALITMRAIAKKYEIAIVYLSQLNKTGDAFNSSYIEQYTHAMYTVTIDKDAGSMYKAPIMLDCSKNRGGPSYMIGDPDGRGPKYDIDLMTGRITQRDEEEDDDIGSLG